jgi:hypothetical protein
VICQCEGKKLFLGGRTCQLGVVLTELNLKQWGGISVVGWMGIPYLALEGGGGHSGEARVGVDQGGEYVIAKKTTYRQTEQAKNAFSQSTLLLK